MKGRIAALLSGRHGRGSNLNALADACENGSIPGEIVSVIGSHGDSPALLRARERGLPTLRVPLRDEETYPQRLLAALSDANPDCICLCGYLRRLPPEIVERWEGCILNIHPSLLPAFGGQGMYGINVHRAAIECGVKISGCTVHLVNQEYDAGPIVLQRAAPVEPGDDAEQLAARVLEAELMAYPEAVALLLSGRVQIEGRRTRILPAGSP